MNITYNGLNTSDATDLICFTDIPNILKVEDDGDGSYANLTLTFQGNLASTVTKDGQYYITFLGETITNVRNVDDAINRNFFISSTNNVTAAYVAKAFRNCPTIAANFRVENNGAMVKLIARNVGTVWGNASNVFQRNIANTYLSASVTDGTSYAELYGAKINVDIYKGEYYDEYITTLEKNYYGSECSFDLSPVLTTLAERGKANPYCLKVSSLKGDSYNVLGNLEENYITQGYMCNQGDKYISLGALDGIKVAQNFNRGTQRSYANNTLLYIYGTTVPLSLYKNNVGGITVQYDYVDSDNTVLATGSTSFNMQYPPYRLWNFTIDLASNTGYSERFKQSTYIDLHVAGQGIIRYNVIKPLKATEYYQRVYWRNSYGGISFFDFTGQKTETRDLETSTYQKSIYDYYDDPRNELDKIYDNEIKYSVTLKSHLFENDGKYVFNDLMQSPEVWTEINGQQYAIIIDTVSVEETDRNNIYEATVKYHYSQEPSLI